MKSIILSISLLFLVSCSTEHIKNTTHKNLTFNNIKSTYKITDINNYKCKAIDKSVIKHVLINGITATQKDVHDYHSVVGCSIDGTLDINGKNTTFNFDYGGILQLGTGQTIACEKICCENNFKYCTWDKNE